MSEGGWLHWLRWWGGATFAALCTGAAFVAQTLPGERLSPWTHWTITLGGAAATVVAFLLVALPTWDQVRSRKDAEQLAKAEVANYLTLISVLLPLTEIFDRIITAPNEIGRTEAKGAMKQAVANYFVQFTGVPQAHSCYFDYEHIGPESRLVCRGIYAGRDSRPRTEFSSADPNHAEIFRLLENRQSELRENTDLGSPPRFPLNRDYKTYISVPVGTSAEIFGLLTLEALHPGELLPQHEKEMLLFAQLLGIALASNGNGRSSTNSIAAAGRQRPARPARSATRRGASTA